MSWDDDETPGKIHFREKYPGVKHPDKRIGGWRKSLIARELKKAKRQTKDKVKRVGKNKKKNKLNAKLSYGF